MLDFDAGKYGPYVWPAYVITALIFAIMIADSVLRTRRWRKAVEEAEQAAGKDKPGMGPS